MEDLTKIDQERAVASEFLLLLAFEGENLTADEIVERVLKLSKSVNSHQPRFWFYLGFGETVHTALPPLTWFDFIERVDSEKAPERYCLTPIGVDWLRSRQEQVEEFFGISCNDLRDMAANHP